MTTLKEALLGTEEQNKQGQANLDKAAQSGSGLAKFLGGKEKPEPVKPEEPEEPEVKEFFEKAKEIAKKLDEDKIEIEKENIAEIEEPTEEPIVIDSASGESIPPISKGKRGFPVRKTKAEDISKYDEGAELAFREKQNKLDGGNF
jgi:hypothetical protein